MGDVDHSWLCRQRNEILVACLIGFRYVDSRQGNVATRARHDAGGQKQCARSAHQLQRKWAKGSVERRNLATLGGKHRDGYNFPAE